MAMIKFFWNGMKASDGKLQPAIFSKGELINYPKGTMTIYARGIGRFSKEIAEAFVVKNDTDTMTDYFAGDTIRVLPDHPFYAKVCAAYAAREAHYAARRG
jgi:hypothetical protein